MFKLNFLKIKVFFNKNKMSENKIFDKSKSTKKFISIN
jgi:hypothetical protein